MGLDARIGAKDTELPVRPQRDRGHLVAGRLTLGVRRVAGSVLAGPVLGGLPVELIEGALDHVFGDGAGDELLGGHDAADDEHRGAHVGADLGPVVVPATPVLGRIALIDVVALMRLQAGHDVGQALGCRELETHVVGAAAAQVGRQEHAEGAGAVGVGHALCTL